MITLMLTRSYIDPEKRCGQTRTENNMNYKAEYDRWMSNVLVPDLIDELKGMDDAAIEDAFYRDLAFGTGGLRGVIGAGTNRVNIYTIAKASQGLADYVNKNFPEGERSIAISHDSRIKSDVFARVAAGVFAANGINAHIYTELMPTPCLSYAVRALKCSAGIMVTASHNPSKYNGYKVYGADGCQITTEAADAVTAEIEKLDIFEDVKMGDFNEYLDTAGSVSIKYISDQIYTDFVEEVKKQSLLGPDDEIDRNVAIVYSPLNGTGLKPVTRTLKETGFTNITVVKEQEQPDGNFPTCPYPNPEIREAMQLGIEYARKNNADLLLATDPDCDRVGIAVKDRNGEYVLLTGNQTGCLLIDYVCSQRVKNDTMPKDPIVVKTIVSTDLADQIAESYGAKVTPIDTFEQSVEMVASGRAEATINSELVYADYMKNNPDAPLKVVASTEDVAITAIPVSKGQQNLVDALNKAIDELREDGTLGELSVKYFDVDVTVLPE